MDYESLKIISFGKPSLLFACLRPKVSPRIAKVALHENATNGLVMDLVVKSSHRMNRISYTHLIVLFEIFRVENF